jgi:hypothetical protein
MGMGWHPITRRKKKKLFSFRFIVRKNQKLDAVSEAITHPCLAKSV